MNERLGYDAMIFSRNRAERSDESYAQRRASRRSNVTRGDSDMSARSEQRDFRETYDTVARNNRRADRSRGEASTSSTRTDRVGNDGRGEVRDDARREVRERRADEVRERRAEETRGKQVDEHAAGDTRTHKKETASTPDDRPVGKTGDGKSDDSRTVGAREQTAASHKPAETTDDKHTSEPVSTGEQGWHIIRQSLGVISETFQLDLVGPVEDLELTDVNEQVASQFAEVLQMLNGIAGVLDESAQKGETLQFQGMTIEPEKAVELSKAVRYEVFRLEMAFGMIGAGEKVGAALAKSDANPGFLGIPVARNPADLQMPSWQLDGLLDKLKDTSESTIDSIVSKMKHLAKGADGAQGVSIEQAVVVKPKASSQEQLKALDSPVYRAMLKLDAGQGTVTQPASPEGDGSSQGGSGGQGGQGGAFQQNQAFLTQALNQMRQNPENSGVELSVDASTGVTDKLSTQFQSLDAATRSSIPTYKSIEESVMQQVNERLGAAVRNGVHELRIHLRPESLGEVQLKIQMEGDIVTAKIRVESQQVKQIMEANLQALRDSLEEQNLHAGSFDVDVNHHSGEQTQTAFQAKEKLRGGGDENWSESTEELNQKSSIGLETGRRFGDNTVEYFA